MREEVNAALADLIEEEVQRGAGEVALEAGRVLNAGGKRLRPLLFCSLIVWQGAQNKTT